MSGLVWNDFVYLRNKFDSNVPNYFGDMYFFSHKMADTAILHS